MIEQATQQRFYIVCDFCGASSPPARSEETARIIARSLDFEIDSHHNGLAVVTRYKCPACVISEQMCYCGKQAAYTCDDCGLPICAAHTVIIYGDDDVPIMNICQECAEDQ